MSQETIERAARAIRDAENASEWEGLETTDGIYRHYARAVIAAIHPTVSTEAELDALPENSVVLDSFGEPFQRMEMVGLPSLWSSSDVVTSDLMHLPATVLHIPGGAQ